MRLKWKYLLGASLVAAMASTASVGWSSSHREAPGTAGKPRIDSTDFYMFRSYEPGREKYVTLIANYLPLQHPYGGPNYFVLDNDAVYEIHIDNNGDAVEDMTFQFDFDTRLANQGKGITLKVGGKDVAIPLRQGGPDHGAGRRHDQRARELRAERDPRRPPRGQEPAGHAGERPELRQADRQHRHQDPAQLRRLRPAPHLLDQRPGLLDARPGVRGAARRGVRGEPRPDLRPGELRAGRRRQRARSRRRQGLSGRHHPGAAPTTTWSASPT